MSGLWLGGKSGDWWADDPSPDSTACETQPTDRQEMCTRTKGHYGRHIATIGAGTVAIAAWPGDHEPTAADLIGSPSTALVLWQPVMDVANPGPEIRYRPPRDTCDPRYAACTAHRPGCDCREAYLAEQIAEGRYAARQNRLFEDAIEAVVSLHGGEPGGYCRAPGCLNHFPCPTRNMLAPLSWREQMGLTR